MLDLCDYLNVASEQMRKSRDAGDMYEMKRIAKIIRLALQDFIDKEESHDQET